MVWLSQQNVASTSPLAPRSLTSTVNTNNEQNRLHWLAHSVFWAVAASHKPKWLSGLENERCMQTYCFASIARQYETSVYNERGLNTIDCVLWRLCFDWFCSRSAQRSISDFSSSKHQHKQKNFSEWKIIWHLYSSFYSLFLKVII